MKKILKIFVLVSWTAFFMMLIASCKNIRSITNNQDEQTTTVPTGQTDPWKSPPKPFALYSSQKIPLLVRER